MRVVLTVVGMLIGAGLADPGARLIDAIIGGALGFGIAELSDLRTQQRKLAAEIKRLRADLPPSRITPSPVTQAPETSPVAQPRTTLEFRDFPRSGPGAGSSPAEKPPPRPEAPPEPVTPQATRSAAARPAAAHSATAPTPTGRRPSPPADELPFVAAIRSFFTGGNAMVRVGVIVLFFGVAFLLRYMAEHSRVPIEYRLTGVAFGSLILLGFGWRLRHKRTGYALAVQGGGVGILYLTVFAALRLYGVLPATLAFPLLAGVAVLSAALAILQDSLWFALLGVTGGFLAPVLASTGEGSHVVLFSYYAVLNLGIFAVAWFKAWRPLNIAGFVFTFAVGTAWGVLRYSPDQFSSTEPFLILFFVFYFGISVLFTLRQPAKLSGYIDGTLIFGTPIVVFALQSAMLHERLMLLAYSALAMSGMYVLAAQWLKSRRDESQALLIEAFVAVGVVFLTLAMPLALNARWNAAAWALEGSALIWVGCRQSRVLPRIFGVLLNFAAGLMLTTQFDTTAGHPLLAASAYLGLVTVAAGALFSARTLRAHAGVLGKYEHPGPELLFCWALLWWVIGGLCEISRYLPEYETSAGLIFATVTTSLSSEIHRRLGLGSARVAALLQWPVMLLIAGFAHSHMSHPAADGGWLSWPVALAGAYVLMHRHEGAARANLAGPLNSLTLWLICALSSWELVWSVELALPNGPAWSTTAKVVIPALALFLLPVLVTRVSWPFARNRSSYAFLAGTGIALYLAAWSLNVDLSPGGSAPLPYLPLLNPLDMAQAFVILVLCRHWQFLHRSPTEGFARTDPRISLSAICVLAFVWLNAMLLQAIHHWFAVPFDIDSLAGSTLVQTSLSIFWATLALLAMLVATRQGRRIVWLVGAGLLALVTAKLFLIDLSKVGSIDRIVSFLGVGLLMLTIGYFSPLPPAEKVTR